MSSPRPVERPSGTPPTPAENPASRLADAAALAREAELASGADACRLWLTVARIREESGDVDGAIAALESARRADDSAAAIAELRRLALKTWRWPLAADVLAIERKRATGPAFAARTLELAEVLAERLGRADEALPMLQELLQGDPSNAAAIARAVPLLTGRAAWSELIEVLVSAADAVAESDKARASAHLYEAGEIARWRLHSLDRAAELFERAVTIHPEAGAAAKALSETASELRDWRRLALALEREASLASAQEPRSPEMAAAALVKLGSIREELLKDADGAEQAYRLALESEPANRAALASLSRIAEQKKDQPLRAELLERRLLLATDVKEAIAISLALGTLYEESLGSKERAANHYRRVLAVTADEAPAFRALGRLQSSTGDWRGLIELYEREAKETPDPLHRTHCLFKIAELHEEKLGEDEKAVAAYRRVLESAPTYLPALRALGRLFQRNEDWHGLIDLYQGEADATSDDTHAVGLLEHVADLWEEKLGNLDAAVRVWERILAKLPEHLPALRALGRLHYKRGAWEALVAINLREAAATKDPRVVAALLHKTGEVYEDRLKSPEDAIRCYRSALDHVPNYLPAMRSLGRLAGQRGQWAEVVHTEELEAEGTADVRRAVSLLASAAEHYETKLEDPEKAITSYEKVLSKVPGYLPAVAGLARLYRKAGRWDDLIRVLEASVPPMDRDPGAATAVLAEIAGIEGHHLGHDIDAEKRIAAARAAAPRDLVVRREHEEYLAKQSSWGELAILYAASVESASQGPLRAALLVRLGDLARRDGDDAKAAGHYRAALSSHPGDRAAASALEHLGRAKSDDKMRIEGLSALAMSAATPVERRGILVELARLYERTGDPAGAEGCWSAAVQIRGDLEAYESLAQAAAKAGRHAEAADAWANAELAAEESDKERLALACAEALAAAGEWARAEEKIRPLAEKTGAGPSIAALLLLERICAGLASAEGPGRAAALDRWTDVQRRLAAVSRDPARKAELNLKVATTLAGPLGRSSEAAAMLEQVVASETSGTPSHREALARLAELYAASGDGASQAATLERLAESASGEAKATLLIQAGDVLREIDPDRAITCWEKAATADPTSMKALRRLVELYQHREAWQSLLATWNRVISATKDPKVAAEAFHAKGVVLQERLKLPDKAEQHFQRALAADAGNGPAMERLAQVHADAGRVTEARALLQKLVAAGPEDSIDTHERMIKLARLERASGDNEAALSLLQQVMARFPARTDVHEEILSILEARPDGPAYIAALRNASLTAVEPRRSALRRRLAKALEERSGDEAGAAAEYRALSKANPDDVEVRAALAALLSKKKENRPDAIAAHASVLKLAPMRVESLKWLASTFEELKHHDKVLCLVGVLQFLESASADQEIFYKDQVERAPRRANASIGAEDRRSLLIHPDARNATGDLLTRLGGAMWAGITPDLSSVKGDRLRPGDKNPLRGRLDNQFALFGVPMTEALVLRDKSNEVTVLVGEPPVILIGGGVASLPAGVQDFLLGRAIFRMATAWLPAGRSAAEIRSDLWLAAAGLELTDTPKGSDPKRAKAIGRAVPKKLRKELSEQLEAFAGRPTSFDVEGFVRGSERSADRAGLLACVDVARAIEGMALADPALAAGGDEPMAAKVARSPAAKELLAFATSDELFTLRKKTGLTIFPA